MRAHLSRCLMALAAACLGESRREWSMAMLIEFEHAVAPQDQLRFAGGCLIAAWRQMLRGEEGRFMLASYALATSVIVPMAALQIGCALLNFPYLYPGQQGIIGALTEGRAYEHLLRGVYQATILPIALLQLALAVGHLRLGWSLLERDWPAVLRFGMQNLAAAVTLVSFMAVLFLDSRQALLQGVVIGIEIATILALARWHRQFTCRNMMAATPP